MNCPHCNENITVIRAGRTNGARDKVYQMSAWLGAGADTLERTDAPTVPAPSFKQEPARAPTVQSDVVVPALRSVITGVGVGACTAGVALMTGVTTPGAFAGIGFAVAATGWWLRDVGELKSLMWRIEERFDRDINNDGQVGQPAPPVDRLVPVFAGSNVSAVDMTELPPASEGTRLIQLEPHTDRIEKQRLWDYLIGAFETGDWSRDGDAKGIGCIKLGITTKLHPQVRDFVSEWDEIYGVTVWGLTGEENRPALEHRLRSLGWTDTNERERERTNGES